MPKVLLMYDWKAVGGVQYFRMSAPCNVLSNMYPDWEFTSLNGMSAGEDVLADEGPNQFIINDDYFKQFDLIHFCRGFAPYVRVGKVAERLERIGVPYGVDVDDFWELPKTHILLKEYQEKQETESVKFALKKAKFVTCTTPILAEEVRKLNKNVYIIENGIDSRDPMWQPSWISDKLRFGFMQGTTHLQDLQLMKQSIHKMFDEPSLRNKFQIKLAGFGGKHIEKGEQPSIPIIYEAVITDSFKKLRPLNNYIDYLKLLKPEHNDIGNNYPYQRIWARHVDEWGWCYDEIDISLIPLVDNKFNSCKSELKMIEAGMKGKAVIVSGVAPYTLLANDKNAFIVDKYGSFYLAMKRAIDNPAEVEDKAHQLHEDVMAKYDLCKLSQKRKFVYSKNFKECVSASE